MNCQYEGCKVDLELLLNVVEGEGSKIVYCPNHILMDWDNVQKAMQSAVLFNENCDCCENEQTLKLTLYQSEMKLCVEHASKLFLLSLEPEAFKELYKLFPNEHLLHDDFYDEVSGMAIQPVIMQSVD